MDNSNIAIPLDQWIVPDWWREARYWEDNQSPRVKDIVVEAQKRILEKAVERLDRAVTAFQEDKHSMEYTNGYLDSIGEAVKELKSLMEKEV